MKVFFSNFRGGSVQYFKSLALDWRENKNNLKSKRQITAQRYFFIVKMCLYSPDVYRLHYYYYYYYYYYLSSLFCGNLHSHSMHIQRSTDVNITQQGEWINQNYTSSQVVTDV